MLILSGTLYVLAYIYKEYKNLNCFQRHDIFKKKDQINIDQLLNNYQERDIISDINPEDFQLIGQNIHKIYKGEIHALKGVSIAIEAN